MKQFNMLICQLFAIVLLTMSGSSFAQTEESSAQTSRATPESVAEKEMTRLAGDEFFQQVKEGQAGYTTSQSMEHDVLVSTASETWFVLKEKWMSPLGAIAVVGCLAMVLLVYLLMGPVKLSAPRTGRKIKRWTRLDRTIHWSMAFTFLTLAFTGMTLVWGKWVIKPIVPTSIWADIIYLAKQVHNYIGPLFFILLFIMLIKWFSRSIIKKVDIEWCLKFGGMIGKHKGSHPSAEFSNAGEKILFWILMILGAIAAVTGFILDFPIFGQGRRDMELSNLVHMIAALVLICGFIFHIYVGLVGIEGSLEGMVKGEVDETWAKEHHDLWYEEVKDLPENQTSSAASSASVSSTEPTAEEAPAKES